MKLEKLSLGPWKGEQLVRLTMTIGEVFSILDELEWRWSSSYIIISRQI